MGITHASEQGMRSYQEDRFFVKQIRLKRDSGVFLAVMDGHGGQEVAQFCSNSLSETISKVIKGKDMVDEEDIQAIVRSLNKQTSEMESGSTLSLVFVSKNRGLVCVGILGDSPVIIKNSRGQVITSPEHNARTNMEERESAISLGAHYHNGYIWDPEFRNGLQMTRALGDRNLQKFLDRVPEVYSVNIGPESFVTLLSDGVVDPGHGGSDSLKHVISMIENGASASDLVVDALKRKTRDNATAVVWRN